MPTRKISDFDRQYCRHPDHDPPNMQVFTPGTYEHECPACRKKVVFSVGGTFCSAGTTIVPVTEIVPSQDYFFPVRR